MNEDPIQYASELVGIAMRHGARMISLTFPGPKAIDLNVVKGDQQAMELEIKKRGTYGTVVRVLNQEN